MTEHIVGAILVRHDRVLLAHRHPHRRWYPNVWDVVGGHVEPGESPEETLVRECQEELGITPEEFAAIEFAIADPNLTMTTYLVTRWRGEPVNNAPDEHDDLAWFSAAEIADLTLAHPAGRAALQALAGPAQPPG